jgi:type IV pilus assembly protein PilF
MPPVRTLLFALLLALAACRHVPTDKEKQVAEIHHDLGIQAQESGDVQGAYAEFSKAVELDPGFAEAHNALGLLLHMGFKKHDEAIEHYKRALKIRPGYSDVKTNLANLYLDLGRYDEAIALYDEALNDMTYGTPYIAQGNLGWAWYKKGNAEKAVQHIKSAVTINPKFCAGYRNLGMIYDAQGEVVQACRQFANYREQCPESADAHYREGRCLAKSGQTAAAKQSFNECVSKAEAPSLKDDCRALADQLR